MLGDMGNKWMVRILLGCILVVMGEKLLNKELFVMFIIFLKLEWLECTMCQTFDHFESHQTLCVYECVDQKCSAVKLAIKRCLGKVWKRVLSKDFEQILGK